MAYRRPGVTVTQEFAAVAPALAAFSLPSVTIGKSYQLVDADSLGVFAGSELLFPYAGKLGGAIVDLEELASDEYFPIIKKPISAELRNTQVEVLAEQTTGAVAGTAFTDATTSQFIDVLAGDYVEVMETLGLTIVAARSDGETTTANPNRLFAGSGNPTLFADVKVGDEIVVTAGTNTNAGTYTVTGKVGTDLLLVTGTLPLNDGVGAATNVAYSITSDRGSANAGEYKVKSKTDDNTLVLESPMTDTPESPLTYLIKRKVGVVVLDRVDTLLENGYVASADGLTLPTGLEVDGLVVLEGDLYASYRALRIDLANEIREFVDVASMNAVFGVGQLVPANELAYGVSVMLQNTVTPVNGLGLDANGEVNEVLAYTAALDVLKRYDMYAIGVLTQNPVVHTMFKNHVEQMSLPQRKLERVVIFNSELPTLAVMQDAQTTVITGNGSRQIVGMQVDGSGNIAIPNKLSDSTTGQFANVAAGDSLVIVGGTGVTAATYVVAAVADDNNLTTTTNFIASGTPTDIQYYIYRKDGISVGGASFYDRNAHFLSNGAASGHLFSVLSGAFAGRYTIATVVSEKEITLLPVVAGVATLATGIEYQIDRDLTKHEQADAVKGYSESFASRRCVHIWPDILEAPVGATIYKLPGYFGVCTINALTTGLPTQQGLTNLAVSGFLGFEHSTRYFTEEQLDEIADGGTMILAQDGPQQPLYVRHQLTTDRSSIKFQEYSVTKNVDFIAKFWRTTYARFIGQYNIIDTTIDALNLTASAGLKFLKDQRVPRFGGVIRGGNVVSLVESTTAIDTVEIVISHNIPIPLNNIDITIQV